MTAPAFNIPVVCRNCGLAFPSGIVLGPGVSAQLESFGAGPCPRCGHDGVGVDGLYQFIDETAAIVASRNLSRQQARRIARTVDRAKDPAKIPESLAAIDSAIGAVATEAIKRTDWKARLWLLGKIVMFTIGAGVGAEGWTNTLDKLGLLERVREAIGTSEADGKTDKMSKDAPKQHHQKARSVADNSSSDEGKTEDRDLRNEGFALYQPGETPGQSIIRGDDVTKGGSGNP